MVSKDNPKTMLSHILVESSGPWPFITRRIFQKADASLITWLSRRHRKIGRVTENPSVGWGWRPDNINWWIGVLFACGALLFSVASLVSINQTSALWLGLDASHINVLFFAGSIPFTTAAYLQLFQAANTPALSTSHVLNTSARKLLIGWRPKDIGWLSCVLQFPGTVLFNFNTLDVFIPGLSWWQQDLAIWVPNILGSILFLASGYLAFMETCHSYFAWRLHSLSWWVTFINLLGCVGFMIAAIFAIIVPSGSVQWWVNLSLICTLQGGVCFFIGSLLMLPETLAPSK